MDSGKLNANPTVYAVGGVTRNDYVIHRDEDDEEAEDIDAQEVFDHIRYLNDPEHPLTLEQLNITTLENVFVNNRASTVDIRFTPTIPHCSMATLIGLCIRVKLMRSMPSRFKISIHVAPGSHSSEHAVNKQLNDKERVAAALENPSLLGMVDKCIAHTDQTEVVPR